MFKILESLNNNNLCGVSGNERELAETLGESIKEYLNYVSIDKHNNLIAVKEVDGNKKILISCAIDEKGFVIKDILRNGLIEAIPIGGFSMHGVILGYVTIHGKKNIDGICIPDEVQGRSNSIFIETGYKYEELKEMVKIGDPISLQFKENFNQNEEFIYGVRNNVVCASILSSIAEKISNKNLNNQVIFIGLSKIKLGCVKLDNIVKEYKPDLMIYIDIIKEYDEYSEKNDYRISEGIIINCGVGSNEEYFNDISKFIVDNFEKNIKYKVCGSANKKCDLTFNTINRKVPVLELDIASKFTNSISNKFSIKDIDYLIDVISSYVSM